MTERPPRPSVPGEVSVALGWISGSSALSGRPTPCPQHVTTHPCSRWMHWGHSIMAEDLEGQRAGYLCDEAPGAPAVAFTNKEGRGGGATQEKSRAEHAAL